MKCLYKKAGETPLAAIQAYKKKHPELSTTLLSYAGRLDPMAEGLLLLLEGAENKQRRLYEHLQKRYEFDILVGFSTDTYDVMGEITHARDKILTQTEHERIKHILFSYLGEKSFPYPPYSSKYVNGHPLFWYARRNLLHTITIPIQTVRLSEIHIQQIQTLPPHQVLSSIEHRLSSVSGDFRQHDILGEWKKRLEQTSIQLPVYSCSISCSSGTYIRSIVHDLSQRTSIPMLTYTIKRIQIGDWTINQVVE